MTNLIHGCSLALLAASVVRFSVLQWRAQSYARRPVPVRVERAGRFDS